MNAIARSADAEISGGANIRSSGRRLNGSVVQKIGRDIVSGHYPPGSILCGEVVFAQELEVSRSAYRESLRVLSAKGLIESRPKAGTRVLPRECWNVLDPDVLEWAFTGKPDFGFIRDIFELRGLIEPAAAGLAAQRRSREDVQALRRSIDAMRGHTLASEPGRHADRDFHQTILKATGNGALMVLTASVGAAVRWTTQLKQQARTLPRNAIPEHVEVCEAIAARDSRRASEGMNRLIEQALEDTRNAVEAL
jgi:DNA-binding FadR family transcriptional regulator